ncbi:MAG: hypothetical protein K2X38_16810 [Gemmataceae bacterium]|nr:hypothetical protein [Gemmataceae bacterium]
MLELRQFPAQLKSLASETESDRNEALRFFKDVEMGEWVSAPADQVERVVKAVQHQLSLKPKRPAVRQGLLAILANIGPKAEGALPEMLEMLRDRSSDGTREAAAVAISRLGEAAKPALDDLLDALGGARSTLGCKVLRAIAAAGVSDKKVKTTLVTLWNSTELTEFGRSQVAYALCKLGIEAEYLYGVLANTLVNHKEAAQRKAAVEAISFCNPNSPDVCAALMIAIAKDKNDDVKAQAEEALETMGVTLAKAIKIAAKQLGTSNFAEAALRGAGEAAVADLTEAAKSTDPATVEKAVRTLGALGEPAKSAAPVVTKLLSHKQFEVRLSAAKTLWNIAKDAEHVVPVLIDLLNDKWYSASAGAETRRQAMQTVIESLWRIGPDAMSAVPALTKKAKDSNRLVSESAQHAIQKIAPNGVGKAAAR